MKSKHMGSCPVLGYSTALGSMLAQFHIYTHFAEQVITIAFHWALDICHPTHCHSLPVSLTAQNQMVKFMSTTSQTLCAPICLLFL